MPSLVIHLMLAAAVAAPAAPASMPTAFSRLEVTKAVPIHPAIWEGTAHSCSVRPQVSNQIRLQSHMVSWSTATAVGYALLS